MIFFMYYQRNIQNHKKHVRRDLLFSVILFGSNPLPSACIGRLTCYTERYLRKKSKREVKKVLRYLKGGAGVKKDDKKKSMGLL
jgi:hypothetical protein